MTKSRLHRSHFLFALAMVAVPVPSIAYELRGSVLDACSGGIIAGATVSYTGTVRGQVLTDETGSYAITRVPNGLYELEARVPGYVEPGRATVRLPFPGRIDLAPARGTLEATPETLIFSLKQGGDPMEATVTLANSGCAPLDIRWYERPLNESGSRYRSAFAPGRRNPPDIEARMETNPEPVFRIEDSFNEFEIHAPVANNRLAPIVSMNAISSAPAYFGEEIFRFNVSRDSGDNTVIGIEFDGEFFYATGANNHDFPNLIHKFTRDGEYIDSFPQPRSSSFWGWTDMAWDGQFLYGSDGKTIVQCTTDGTYVTEIRGPGISKCMALAYDPRTDRFWTTHIGELLYEIDREGNIYSEIQNPYQVTGLAWDDASEDGPWLWAFTLRDERGAIVRQFDPRIGRYTGVEFVASDNQVAVAGGLCFTTEWDPRWGVLFGMVQFGQDIAIGFKAAIADPFPWMTVEPETAALSPMESREFVFRVYGELEAGTHEAVYRLQNDGPTRSPLFYPIRIEAEPGAWFEVREQYTEEQGDGDGTIEAGEVFEVTFEIRHRGELDVSHLVATLKAVGVSSGYASVETEPISLGPMKAGESLITPPWRVRLSEEAPVEGLVHLRLTFESEHGGNPVPIEIRTGSLSEIQGRVFDLCSGEVVPDTLIFCRGPMEATGTVNATGEYSIVGLVPGIYEMRAVKPGYLASSPFTLQVPPNPPAVDFTIGRGDPVLSSEILEATLYQGHKNDLAFEMTNQGCLPIRYFIQEWDADDIRLKEVDRIVLEWPKEKQGSFGLDLLRNPLSFLTRTPLFGVSEPSQDPTCQGVEFDGETFYVSGANGHRPPTRIHRFSREGKYLGWFSQYDGWSYWGYADLAFDGEYLYGSDNETINQIALDGTFIRRFPGPGLDECLAIAHDPMTDRFWTAEWDSGIYEIDRWGGVYRYWELPYYVFGLAWDSVSANGPWLWAFTQDGETFSTLLRIDPETGMIHGEYSVGDASLGIAGGMCFTNRLVPDKAHLVVVHQGSREDTLVTYEIGPGDRFPWINAEPIAGNLPVGGTEEIMARFSSWNAEPGVHEAQLVIGGRGGEISPPVRLPVRLNVLPDIAVGVDNWNILVPGMAEPLIQPGGTFLLWVNLRNSGDHFAENVLCSAHPVNGTPEYVRVLKGSFNYGDILPRTSRSAPGPFQFEVDEGAPNGLSIRIEIRIEEKSGRLWSEILEVRIERRSVLSGSVLSECDDGPIPEAEVILSGSAEKTTTTNERGEFFFQGLPDGFYELNCRAMGKISSRWPIPVNLTGDASVTLRVGEAELIARPDPMPLISLAQGTLATAELFVANRGCSEVTVSGRAELSREPDRLLREGFTYRKERKPIELTFEPGSYVPGEILISLEKHLSPMDAGPENAALRTVLTGYGMDVLERTPQLNLYRMSLETGSDIEKVVRELNELPQVRYAQPNYLREADITLPNDPRFPFQWGLHNTGDFGGVAGADIGAPRAWDVTQGSRAIIVAVIDSGVDYTHPDLAENMWVNEEEVPGNRIDDDGNGFVDDVYGYDFRNHDGDPQDDNGHGTHVAGIIGAVGDNAYGIAGVNWKVRIMALKFLDERGRGSDGDAARAILYAVDNGAHVLNNSWGGSAASPALRDAVDYAEDHGLLFVASAGNNGLNLDEEPHYPASLENENVLTVAATDRRDQLAVWGITGSNYGLRTVDLAAPGKDILSTVPASGFASYNGTSMACPHVTGAAALLLSRNPDLSFRQLRDSILRSVDVLPSLEGKVASGGRLNLAAALDRVTPAGIRIEPIAAGIPGFATARYEVTFLPRRHEVGRYPVRFTFEDVRGEVASVVLYASLEVTPGILLELASVNPLRAGTDTPAMFEPGSLLDLSVTLFGAGQIRANGGRVILTRTENSVGAVEILVSEIEFGRIDPGEAVTPVDRFRLQVSPGAPVGTRVSFSLRIEAQGAPDAWTYPFGAGIASRFDVSGHVFDLCSGLPLGEAIVAWTGGENGSTRTEPDGSFTIWNLGRGEYELTLSAEEYHSIGPLVLRVLEDVDGFEADLGYADIELLNEEREYVLREGESATGHFMIHNAGCRNLRIENTFRFLGYRGPARPEVVPLSVLDQTHGGELGDYLTWFPVTLQVGDNATTGIEFDGEFFYVTGEGAFDRRLLVYRFDRSGKFVSYFSQKDRVPGGSGWQDLAWDGWYLYGSDDSRITRFRRDGEIVGTFPGPGLPLCLGIAANPLQQTFWTTAWESDLFHVDPGGKVLGRFPKPYRIFGLAWDHGSPDGPWLWGASRNADDRGAVIRRFDPETGMDTGVHFPARVEDPTGSVAGLCYTTEYLPGVGILFALIQARSGDYVVGHRVGTAGTGMIGFGFSPRSTVVPPGETVPLSYQVRATEGVIGDFDFEIEVNHNGRGSSPRLLPVSVRVEPSHALRLEDFRVDDCEQGDCDGHAEPGEEFDLHFQLRNLGTGGAENVTGILHLTDPVWEDAVELLSISTEFGNVPSSEFAESRVPLRLRLDTSLPKNGPIPFELILRVEDGREQILSFLLPVDPRYSISGTILDGCNGTLRNEATVTVVGQDMEIARTVSNGHFRVTGLIPGLYSVLAEIPGENVSNQALARLGPDRVLNLSVRHPTLSAPPLLDVWVANGEVREVTLALENIGCRDLVYDTRIDFGLPEAGRSLTSFSGEYSWTDSERSDDLRFEWIPMGDVEPLEFSSPDDATVGPIDLGFTFRLYGVPYTSLYICTNGFISFTSDSVPFQGTPLPNPSQPPSLIAPFWMDHRLEPGRGAIYARRTGEGFLIEWRELANYSVPERSTFQMLLRRDDSILIQYLEVPRFSGLSPAVVAMQNRDFTRGFTVFPGGMEVLQSRSAIRIVPPVWWLSVSPRSGRISSGGRNTLHILADASGFEGYRTLPSTLRIQSNDPDQPVWAIPLTIRTGPPWIPYDPNRDGKTNALDLFLFLKDWYRETADGADTRSDRNQDGIVLRDDLMDIYRAWRRR